MAVEPGIENEAPFVYTLQGVNFVVTSDMGIKQISIVSRSSVDGSVTTPRKLGTFTSNGITLFEDKAVTFGSNENQTPLKGITIVSPSGATIQIIAI